MTDSARTVGGLPDGDVAPSPPVPGTFHPAENRGYRELYALARQLVDHWSRLTERLEVAQLSSGVAAVQGLLDELRPLTASYGLHGKPAAQGVGVSVARSRGEVRDRFLERGQALRLAVLDLQQLTTLLAYLARAAESRRDERLAEFCGRWERKLRRVESAARKAAVEQGGDPDAAIEPLDGSALGRAAHSVSYAVGTVGEWLDRRAAGKKNA